MVGMAERKNRPNHKSGPPAKTNARDPARNRARARKYKQRLMDKSISREMRNTLMDFGGNPGEESEEIWTAEWGKSATAAGSCLGTIKVGGQLNEDQFIGEWDGTSQSDGIPLLTYQRSFHSVSLPSLCSLIGKYGVLGQTCLHHHHRQNFHRHLVLDEDSIMGSVCVWQLCYVI